MKSLTKHLHSATVTMTATNRKRPHIGDVIEIPTPKGMAYAQYSFNYTDPPKYGALLRVLPGLYSERPADFSELVDQEERFYVFFPLTAAIKQGIVRIVGNEEVPEHAKGVPLMRMAGARSKDGSVLQWWLWDGNKEWKVDALDTETRKLSLLQVANDTALVNRIVSGWSPEDEV